MLVHCSCDNILAVYYDAPVETDIICPACKARIHVSYPDKTSPADWQVPDPDPVPDWEEAYHDDIGRGRGIEGIEGWGGVFHVVGRGHQEIEPHRWVATQAVALGRSLMPSCLGANISARPIAPYSMSSNCPHAIPWRQRRTKPSLIFPIRQRNFWAYW